MERRRRGTERAAVGTAIASLCAVGLGAVSFLLSGSPVGNVLFVFAGLALVVCGALMAGNGRLLEWAATEQPQTKLGHFVADLWFRPRPLPRRISTGALRFITVAVGIGAIFIGCGWIAIAVVGS